MKRYIKVTKKFSFGEANRMRLDEIQSIRARAEELLKEVTELENTPLPTEITYQREVNPGEQGYESATPVFDPTLYIGEMKWIK